MEMPGPDPLDGLTVPARHLLSHLAALGHAGPHGADALRCGTRLLPNRFEDAARELAEAGLVLREGETLWLTAKGGRFTHHHPPAAGAEPAAAHA